VRMSTVLAAGVAMLDESLHFSDDSLNYLKVGKDIRQYRVKN
jgi:hypothetical protein